MLVLSRAAFQCLVFKSLLTRMELAGVDEAHSCTMRCSGASALGTRVDEVLPLEQYNSVPE